MLQKKERKKKVWQIVICETTLLLRPLTSLYCTSITIYHFISVKNVAKFVVNKFINFGKLHFTTLKYVLIYTLYPKLFKYIICTLNYNFCYTLYPNVSFILKV